MHGKKVKGGLENQLAMIEANEQLNETCISKSKAGYHRVEVKRSTAKHQGQLEAWVEKA